MTYTRWYRVGTVDVTQGSRNITGTSAYWLSAALNPGDLFSTDNGKTFYEIEEITDSSHIKLATPYEGATLAGIPYSIVRNFNSGMSARIAAEAAKLLGDFDRYIDADMQSIHGKSAYEVAVQNGYAGTQAEWLESLKAAGEWENASSRLTALETAGATNAETLATHTNTISSLDARTQILTGNNIQLHNSIARFKDLGNVITDEQRANFASGFKDLWLGDNWTINGHTYWIMKFLAHVFGKSGGGIMMMSSILYNSVMNEENTNEGGYKNSYLANTGLEQARDILVEDWGSSLFKGPNEYLNSRNTSGYYDNGGAVKLPYYCMIPTHTLIFGRAFEPYPQRYYSYYNNVGLPSMMTEHNWRAGGMIIGVNSYWLQDCMNDSGRFLCVGSNGLRCSGGLQDNNANVANGVRVIFFIA